MSEQHFCTCTDTACPRHPSNHDRGCDLCIRKCLAQQEIPSCFFKKVNEDEKYTGYTFTDFAWHVLQNSKVP